MSYRSINTRTRISNDTKSSSSVLADSLTAGIVPANADPKLEPFIFTLPAVGTFPAPAELSTVGAPPAFQFHAILYHRYLHWYHHYHP